MAQGDFDVSLPPPGGDDEYRQGLRSRLERLVRISDGYQSLARSNRPTLAERYDRQLRRLEKLARISERVRQQIGEMPHELFAGRITASLGLTLYRRGETYSATIGRADTALLRAKATGRDRGEVA